MRNDRQLLEDIQDAAEVIRQYTPDNRSAFESDPPVQSHLLRHIQIIGEAASRVSMGVRQAHPEVSWRRIAAMRHVLVHDYFQVDLEQVWEVVINHVPVLQQQIADVIAGLPPE